MNHRVFICSFSTIVCFLPQISLNSPLYVLVSRFRDDNTVSLDLVKRRRQRQQICLSAHSYFLLLAVHVFTPFYLLSMKINPKSRTENNAARCKRYGQEKRFIIIMIVFLTHARISRSTVFNISNAMMKYTYMYHFSIQIFILQLLTIINLSVKTRCNFLSNII